MRLIGPRPERPAFVAFFIQQIEGYAKRHYINPGLTGWAQVNYKYGDSARMRSSSYAMIWSILSTTRGSLI